jgi:hypothetical protein
MKLLVTAASVMLAASGVHGECGVVEPESHSSTQNACVLVTLDGKPARHLSLDITISGAGGESRLKRVTNRHGTFDLKNLSPGANYVMVHTALGVTPTSTAMVLLDVKERVPRSSQISLALSHQPNPPRYEVPGVNMSPPIEFTAPRFAGRIVDPSGTGVPGAKIVVYRRPYAIDPKPMTFQSDDQGEFAGFLESGAYTLVIMAPGFKLRIAGFEVRREASEQRMLVKMNIGSAC